MRLLIAAVLSLSATAYADDLSERVEVPSHPRGYLQLGGGLASSDLYFGYVAKLDGGLALRPWLFLHGGLLTSEHRDRMLDPTILDATIGLEARPCTADGVFCAMVGVDVGVRAASMPPATSMQVSHDTSLIGVGRVGLDIGGRHLRVRPEVATTLSSGHAREAQATLSLAYQW